MGFGNGERWDLEIENNKIAWGILLAIELGINCKKDSSIISCFKANILRYSSLLKV